MVFSDTLPVPKGLPWYGTLEGLFGMDSDSFPVFLAESLLIGAYPIDTLVAERLRTP